MHKTKLLLPAILLLLILSSLASLLLSKSPFNPAQTNLPDGFFQQLHYREYNSQGQLHLQFTTPQLTHFAANNSSNMQAPRMLLIDTKQIPWHISAKRAQAWHGKNTIHLQQHVRFYHPQTSSSPRTKITTSSAYLYPQRSYAISKQYVTMQRPGSVLHGKGVHANLGHGVITLLHQTHGTYRPNTTSTQTTSNRKTTS